MSQISKHLKKRSLPWSAKVTKALKELKLKCQSLPLLKIFDKGHLILKIDSSNNYWGTILIEEFKGNKRICGYKLGNSLKLSTTTHHEERSPRSHQGIKKFQFFLSLTLFVIEIDYKYLQKLLKRKEGEILDLIVSKVVWIPFKVHIRGTTHKRIIQYYCRLHFQTNNNIVDGFKQHNIT